MEGKQKLVAGICILSVLFLFAGCRKEKEPEAEDTFVCYVDTEGTALVKRVYDVQGESADEQITDYLEKMAEDPDSIDYKSIFSGSVRDIPGQQLSEGNLNLYFDEDYTKMDAGEEVLFRSAIVQTLSQVPEVEYIEFLVGDQPLTDQDGREIGYMCVEDFVQNTGSSLYAYQRADLKLYFANENGDMLTAEETSVRYSSNMSVEKLIVEQLIKGPSSEDLKPVIPTETKVLGVSIKDGICYVNLDSGFLNNVYGVNPRVTVYAIVNSIVDGGSSSQVQISVNGETNIQYMGSVDLSKPLSRDLDLVQGE